MTEQNYIRTYVRYVYSTIRSTHRLNCKHSQVHTYLSLNNFAYLSGRSRDTDWVESTSLSVDLTRYFPLHSRCTITYVYRYQIREIFMPHTLTFFIKKPFWAYFVPESIFFVKCDDDIFVKRRTFTFCKMSHFSKNVNHVLFEMSYLYY